MFIRLALHIIAKTITISLMNKAMLIPLIISMNMLSSESSVNDSWCSSMSGITEFRTKDGTYVDCLTKELAIEAEYDFNWKEAIGQSLHYAETTQKKAGILLIKRSTSKKDYYSELNRTIRRFDLPITIFITEEIQ